VDPVARQQDLARQRAQEGLLPAGAPIVALGVVPKSDVAQRLDAMQVLLRAPAGC